MASEVQFSWRTARTAYILIRNRIGQIWSSAAGGSWVSYVTANYANYVFSATEQGTASALFAATFPATIAPGVYSITAKDQVTGTAAETDPTVATGEFQWNGTVQFPLSDLVTSGQMALAAPVKIYRGSQILNFPFSLVSAADHVTPFVSGVVSGQISRDGGSFGALQSGGVTELGLGFYSISLTSGDLLANTCALVFTANGISGGTSDPRSFGMVLQRSSGQG